MKSKREIEDKINELDNDLTNGPKHIDPFDEKRLDIWNAYCDVTMAALKWTLQ